MHPRPSRRAALPASLVSLLCGLALVGAPSASADVGDGGTISGQLTRADGEGAAGVQVWASHYIVGEHDPYLEFAGVTAVSDSNGDYTLTFPEDGTYVVYYAGFNGTPRTSFIPEFYDDVMSGHDAVRFTVADGVAISGIDADLVSQSTEYVTFEGTVTNLAGRGLAGIVVDLYCAGDNPGTWIRCMGATTRADGSYSLEELSRGEYRLSFTDPTGEYEYEYYDNAPAVGHGNTITSTTVGETKQMPAVALAKQAVERVEAPTVKGKAAVGKVLTVDPGTWSVADPQLSYQWYTTDGNEPIPGATSQTYAPVAGDLGDQLYAEVTVKAPALRYFVDWTPLTEPVAEGSAEPDPDPAVELVTAPTLSGVPAVGKRVSVRAGEWSPTGVTLSYRWLRDGRPIEGATRDSYRPTAADLGDELSVRVTAEKAGHTSGTATTESSTVQPGTIVNKTPPSFSGRTSAGKTLTADKGAWRPRKVTVSYQWLRDGAPIPRATDSRYTVRRADRGHRLSLTVTVGKRGYAPVSMTSDSKKIR